MIRQIIEIDVQKCDGCGLCVGACHEGAIGLENGKAKLLRDDYCDGLGNCLPVCPAGAIRFIEREAAAFDEAAAAKNAQAKNECAPALACGCPGTHSKKIDREHSACVQPLCAIPQSQLAQWPVQIKLVPVNAPYFNNAALLVAADCAAYAYANFHAEFMKSRIAIIGCPKLDDVDYTEKLAAILKSNDVKSLAVVRMEVPCCAGIVRAAVDALTQSGKVIPRRIITLSTDGAVIKEE